ncbi:hypothetical protein [Bradyrhizobium sp. USDA 4486]
MTSNEHFLQASRRRLGDTPRHTLRLPVPIAKLGAVRTVILTRRHVFKLPGRWTWASWRWWWDFLLRGLLSNMQEARFAAEGWPELCPVRFHFAGGLLVVMPRARMLTDAEWQSFDYRAFVTRGQGYVEANFDALAGNWHQGEPGQPLHSLVLGNAEPDAGIIPAEYKRESYGVLDGRVVAVDYG